MTVDVQVLYLVRYRFDLPAMLRRVGADARSAANFDIGYLVHWQLVSLFGDAAPATFAVRGEDGRWVDVLAYAERDRETLRASSQVAESSALAACDWDRFDAKPMPAVWRAGIRLAFDVRVCPVVRRSKDGPHGRRGAEVDAYLAACSASIGGPAATPVDRMQVYRAWLKREVGREGAATLHEFTPAALRRAHLHRRTQGDGRQAKTLDRPDLAGTGTLVVDNPDAFAGLLRRGLGRHRAFGFGMLLLRPAP